MDSRVSKLKIALLFLGMIIPIVTSIMLSKSLVIGFFIAVFIIVNILMSCGFIFKELMHMIGLSILECKTICLLILMIGATVSIWLASGVVPALIYYGSQLLKDSNFIFMAFIIVMVCSFFIGSAVATISTIGIAIIGIGVSFKIPVQILLGAVVSGAFIADKISPISGLLNLIIESADSNYMDSARSMLRTLIPTVLITSAIYYIIGLRYMGGSDISEVIKLQDMIKSTFNISPMLILI
ncbi:MAG: sodium:proton antiporter, partial [Acidaminobacteraceae bacterium]